MQLTKLDLVNSLNAAGHQITVRRITDWIAKGLLPKLKRGKGSRRAPRYYWDNGEEIIEQAEEVLRLLNLHGRTTPHYLNLWFAGFPISLEIVRPLLKEHFRGRVEWIDSKTEHRNVSVEDVLSNMVIDTPSIPEEDYEIYEFIQNIINNKDFDLNQWLHEETWSSITARFSPKNEWKLSESHWDFRDDIAKLSKEINTMVNPIDALDNYESAKDCDLLKFNQQISTIRRMASHILSSNLDYFSQNIDIRVLRVFLLQILIHCGRWILCIELSAARSGKQEVLAPIIRFGDKVLEVRIAELVAKKV